MNEFLKRAYAELYDLPNFYIGIDDGWKSHVFAILFLILMFGAIVWLVKMMIELRRGRKDRKKVLRNIERSMLTPYDQKLNEKNKNIR